MKPFWKSKTIWVNGLAFAGLVIAEATGVDTFGAEEQGAVIVLVNILLRFATTEPIGR
jgi:hypothetical protein